MLSEIAHPESRRVVHRSSRFRVRCPVCNEGDRAERVASLVRSGSGQFVDSQRGSLHFVSELARDLAPPEQPVAFSYQRAVMTAIAGWLAGALLLLLVEALQAQALISVSEVVLDTARLTTWLWFGGGIPLIAFTLAFTQQSQLESRLPQWQEAIERWAQLYYCPRDDALFLPPLGEAVPPDRIRELLFPEPVQPLEAVR